MKHLNPRQGITIQRVQTYVSVFVVQCETPKSPPGDYNSSVEMPSFLVRFRCETPKSPPGDYNGRVNRKGSTRWLVLRVKHLNPRQGITIKRERELLERQKNDSVKHLNPRQGITISRMLRIAQRSVRRVKHLNPRQGITIRALVSVTRHSELV